MSNDPSALFAQALQASFGDSFEIKATDNALRPFLGDGIIPDVLGGEFEPLVKVNVTYGGKYVPSGGSIAPAETKEEPVITVEGANPDVTYSLLLVDPVRTAIIPSLSRVRYAPSSSSRLTRSDVGRAITRR